MYAFCFSLPLGQCYTNFVSEQQIMTPISTARLNFVAMPLSSGYIQVAGAFGFTP
jgi:hypothetical protein